MTITMLNFACVRPKPPTEFDKEEEKERTGCANWCHSSSICYEAPKPKLPQDVCNAQVRKKIVPVNRKWPLHTLMAALQHHFPRRMDKSHPRHVLIEYVMLKDINDTLEDAHRYSCLPLYQNFNTLSFALVLAHEHQNTCTCDTSNTPQVCAVYNITHTSHRTLVLHADA